MRAILTRRVPIAWFLLVCIATAGVGIAWLAATRDAPPRNAVLISMAGTPTSVSVVEQGTGIPVSAATQAGLVSAPTQGSTLAVFVSGAVVKPGVYTLPVGSRVADAVSAAGGLTSQADMEATNLAARLSDEEQISIPVKGATSLSAPTSPPVAITQKSANATVVKQSPAVATPVSPKGSKININTATQADFETLPSIGPVLAQRIVADRQSRGPFASVDDLTRVSGIKAALLAKIRDLITVGP